MSCWAMGCEATFRWLVMDRGIDRKRLRELSSQMMFLVLEVVSLLRFSQTVKIKLVIEAIDSSHGIEGCAIRSVDRM